jgi:hypothetical protein
MVRSAEKRITTYGSKIDADVIRSRFSALKTTMVESASVKQAEISQIQEDVKNKLEELGYPPEFTVPFMKIGMYLYGLKNKHAGAMLSVEAQAYISAQATKLYAVLKDGAKVKQYLEWILAYFGIGGVTVPNPPAS